MKRQAWVSLTPLAAAQATWTMRAPEEMLPFSLPRQSPERVFLMRKLLPLPISVQ